MESWKATGQTPRILLSGVFGPYGVDDEFGRKENIMELFHNQVTKAQGPASFRFHHRSFGLYFIADNIDADVTVLDFPSRKRFAREVEKGGYDMVGISFIMPNFVKAREMARIVREKAPDAEIVLGGHGAAIEGVEQLIDCDHVVKGEGIRWMREHLGQDPDAPIRHPALPSAERMSILGVPLTGAAASLLVPGVGCVNGCSFCSTSHFFGKRYTAFLDTGRALFETACRIADERGTDSFFVMDENFLKDRERALDLLAEMERHRRFFRFHIFSSAEAITAFGIDNLVRLGVDLVWIGFEAAAASPTLPRTSGIDANRAGPRPAGPRDRGPRVGHPVHGAPHAGEHPGRHRLPGRPRGGLRAVHAPDPDAGDRAVLRTTSAGGCCGRTCRLRSGTARSTSVSATRPSLTTTPRGGSIAPSGRTTRRTPAPCSGWRRRRCAAMNTSRGCPSATRASTRDWSSAGTRREVGA